MKGKADYLFVLAGLLGICPVLPGNADVRCLQLPALDSGCRVGQGRLDIRIGSRDIGLGTVARPKCDQVLTLFR